MNGLAKGELFVKKNKKEKTTNKKANLINSLLTLEVLWVLLNKF